MSVYVDNFVYSLGANVCNLSESEATGRLISAASVLADSGFALHHVCNEEQGAYDLAKHCAEQLNDELDQIGAIIYSTCLPQNANCGNSKKFQESGDVKHLMDFAASRLQADFALENAAVIGLNQQACTGMLGSLRMAKMFLQDEPTAEKVLCVTADRFPAGALYEQSYNLISDGGAACLVSRKPAAFRICVSHSITNGGLAFACDQEVMGSYFSYVHKLIQESLAKGGLTMADIDWIVPQNMNVKAWSILCRLLKFDEARVYAPTRSQIGHMISGDNIANLKHLLEQKLLRYGDKVILIMAGYGLNWQSCILEYCQ
ncbi:MAG: hypothetical protein K2W82_08495 [Candidatus Obscuribacterales bacterium]|nr:hypothetical protein [Candidatus Obscuribacterales bacterium]